MTALAGAPSDVIEHVLPLSECRLRVIDLVDGVRIGELYSLTGSGWTMRSACVTAM